jgi:hypothetical protein
MTAPVYGYQAQLGIDTANPVTVRYDFQTENLALDEHFVDTNGLRGTRARSIERIRAGNRYVHGQLHMQPTAVELAGLLPWILYGAPSGSGTVTYPLADAMPTARYIAVDLGESVNTYNGCQVDRCTIRGSQGQPMDFMIDVVGIDETVGANGTFPALSLDTTTGPFMFTDLVLSVNSTTYIAKDFELIIDNAIDKERFYNSQTLTAAIAMDRHITLQTHLPAGIAEAVYGVGPGGMPVVATFTGGGTSVLTLTFVKVAFPRKSPTYVAGRNEELLPMMGTAYKSGATLELVTTLHE